MPHPRQPVQIQARTDALPSAERYASLVPLGDHLALKKPIYVVAFELSTWSARLFTLSNAISLDISPPSV